MNDRDDLDVSAELSGEYLKKDDVEGGPLQFVVLAAERKQFEARDGKPEKKQWVLTLEGDPTYKLALNQTNLRTFADAWGTKAKFWIGRTFEAYFDATVQMHGKRTGGLRVRPEPIARPAASRLAAAPATVPATTPAPALPAAETGSDNDPIPF